MFQKEVMANPLYIIINNSLFLAQSFYYDVRKNSIGELLKPHLVIYLDTPVNKVLQNIQCRKISYEVKSPVLTTEYLCAMEKYYKQEFLRTIR